MQSFPLQQVDFLGLDLGWKVGISLLTWKEKKEEKTQE
jgi:hypothetical protein